MRDVDKSQEQLLSEVADLRRQNESLQTYKSIMDHLPVGITVCVQEDPEDLGSFRFVLRNSIAQRTTRVPNEMILGKTLRECFPEFLKTEGLRAYAEAIGTGQEMELPAVQFLIPRII